MCFSAAGIENFLIWLVLVCLAIGLLKVFLPWILSLAEISVTPPIMRIINLLIVAAIIIFVIIVAFALYECIAGGGFGLRIVR